VLEVQAVSGEDEFLFRVHADLRSARDELDGMLAQGRADLASGDRGEFFAGLHAQVQNLISVLETLDALIGPYVPRQPARPATVHRLGKPKGRHR
jgi:hypothetical protein